MFIRTPIKTTIPPIFLTMIALMKLPREVIYNVYLIGFKSHESYYMVDDINETKEVIF